MFLQNCFGNIRDQSVKMTLAIPYRKFRGVVEKIRVAIREVHVGFQHFDCLKLLRTAERRTDLVPFGTQHFFRPNDGFPLGSVKPSSERTNEC